MLFRQEMKERYERCMANWNMIAKSKKAKYSIVAYIRFLDRYVGYISHYWGKEWYEREREYAMMCYHHGMQ